ncbi:MAG: Vgb family protein [Actinomycetota bacterium]
MNRSAAAAVLIFLAGCTGPKATPVPSSAASPSPSPSTSGSTPALGLSACPGKRRFATLPVFARGLGAPDDLLALGDGTVWVSDPTHGTVRHLSADGRAMQTIDDAEAPEGIVALGDGRLILAEQRLNRLVSLKPPSGARTVVLQLPSAGAALGVDGIALDAARARIIVPDSARARLFAWPIAGGATTVLATDLGRAVGAAVGPDGQIYVAAEAAAGLLRVPLAGGRGEPLGRVVQADDVVFARGLLYVTEIGSGRLLAVDPATGASRALVDGISQAQGLAVMIDGRLAIADSASGEIRLTDAC